MVVISQIKNLNFQYALSQETNLKNINVDIKTGDFITLAGSSGSGKTTLLRQLKKELWPVGKRSGEILFNGQLLDDLSVSDSAEKIGMVFQDPDSQLVMDTVIQEIAFSLENIGEDSGTIQRKIAELVSFLGFQDLLYTSVHDLSGGQKQLVNLAAVLILQPDLLLLDEPTAQLDPISTKEFINLLQRIHDELGITIVISEHRLDDVLPMSNKVWLMSGGEIVYQGPTKTGILKMWQHEDLKAFIPSVPRLFLNQNLVNPTDDLPLTVVTGKRALIDNQIALEQKSFVPDVEATQTILAAKEVSFQYEKNSPYVLEGLSMDVQQGQWLSIVGKNGTGKSTLLKVLIGILRPRRGSISFQQKSLKKWNQTELFNSIGYLSQKPSDHFSFESVEQEFIQRANQLHYPNPEQSANEMLIQLGIQKLIQQNPHDTSGGEQQLIALGIILLSQPKVLILDEPTKGLDPLKKQKLGNLLKQLQHNGLTIIMASHDMEFSAMFSDKCALLFDGVVTSIEEPHTFFAHNFFYTTAINRMLRYQLPLALTWKEIV